jgi:phage tail-like protein
MRPLASRNANDATWYALQYSADFRPIPDPSIDPWLSPSIDPTLFHDADRHVLELLPAPPAKAADAPAGLAVDVDGMVYRVDARTGQVLVRCGSSERVLVCEPGTILSAGGLALDRRGLLYVADPPAHRVAVVLPDDGHLSGIVAGGLEEPVDVAASPDGRIYVADRKAGRIVVFNTRFARCGDFAAIDAEGTIVTPRPIAVMIAADGAVLVADTAYPRLLRYTPAGELLGDVEPTALLSETGASELDLEAVDRAYGRSVPRFHGGVCGPCRPDRDGGDRLAAVHLRIRLLQLVLGRAYPPCGTFTSAALDGGAPGVEWHKIEIDADLPAGTWLKVQTATDDRPAALGNPLAIPFAGPDDDLLTIAGPIWVPHEDASCAAKPRMTASVPDRLIFSRPGRWLRMRVTLGGDGSATPSVRAIRIFYPRVSYLDLLPRVYRRDPESEFFLSHFLALFEHVLTGVEDRYELFTRQLNPGAAPRDVLDWLACLIDLTFDPSWSTARRRALVEEVMALYAARGTPRGLARYIEIYTGRAPVISEAFLDRPASPLLLGLDGMVLGATTQLTPSTKASTPEDLILSRWAHRFTVVVFVDDECDEEVTRAVVERIITVNKPAHTVHRLRVARVDARAGISRVGMDLMLGARRSANTQIGGCGTTTPNVPRPAVLGADAVLGAKRPAYARQAAPTL